MRAAAFSFRPKTCVTARVVRDRTEAGFGFGAATGTSANRSRQEPPAVDAATRSASAPIVSCRKQSQGRSAFPCGIGTLYTPLRMLGEPR